MGTKTCREDLDGIRYPVEVHSETLYEAAVLGLKALEWIETIGAGTRIDIEAMQPPVAFRAVRPTAKMVGRRRNERSRHAKDEEIEGVVGKLMSVYLSASDETKAHESTGFVTYGGYLGPEVDWTDFFEPAWRERVLCGKPTLDYLHMTDIRNGPWREGVGIAPGDAYLRVDEAVSVLTQMGSFQPVTSSVRVDAFIEHFVRPFKRYRGGSHGVRQPDYLCFIGYVNGVLRTAAKIPGVTKVHFVIEENGKVTKILRDFHKSIAESLTHLGQPQLVELLGDLRPRGKKEISLQAADLFCWHLQRNHSGRLSKDRDGLRRWYHLAKRVGVQFRWTPEDLVHVRNGIQRQLDLLGDATKPPA